MAFDHVKGPPVLDDMMKWHVYIGYSRQDKERVEKLYELLMNNQLTCSLRSSLDVEESSQSDNIKQGITFCHKCLLYISPDYLNDSYSKQELKEAKRKSKFLGNTSVFAIIQSNVSQQQLGRYEQFVLIYLSDNQPLQDSVTNSLMKNSIFSDFELKPELSLVPKQNIGVGVAYTYFFGFLQMVIPDIRKKFEEEMEYRSIDKKCLVKKMLIIIRKTVQSPPKLAEPGVLEQTKYTIKQCADRSGREKREYTVPIYKLTVDNENKDVYYFVGDLPACLYAIREAFDCELTNMSKDEVYEARNEFILTVKALLNHPKYQSSFENQWELLLWPDHDDDDNHSVKLSEFLYQQISSRGLTESSPDSPISPIEDRGTFLVADGISNYPTYREGIHYNLKHSNRGFCIIVSNSSFPNLKERTGAEAENHKLKELFEKLGFRVGVERNLNKDQMMDCLKRYQSEDHSNSDAFVCCLLSHGDKDRIATADEKQVSIITLMELFYENKCPGLKGKPKLFFIGACQGGDAVSSMPAESLSHEARPSSTSSPESRDDVRSSSSAESIDDSSQSSPAESVEFSFPEAIPRSAAETVRDLIPSSLDFIVSYATLPDTLAWADQKEGGLYVDALCKHVTRDLEIDVALRYVNQEVRKRLDEYINKTGERYPRQDPFHIIMPPQKFLFLGSPKNRA